MISWNAFIYECPMVSQYFERYCPRFPGNAPRAVMDDKAQWTKWEDANVWWKCMDEHTTVVVKDVLDEKSGTTKKKKVHEPTPLDPQLVSSKLTAMLDWEWIASTDWTIPIERKWYDMAAGRRPKPSSSYTHKQHTHIYTKTYIYT